MIILSYSTMQRKEVALVVKSVESILQHHVVRSCAFAKVVLPDGNEATIKHRAGDMSIASV
jgi:hypothetical protein